MDEKIERLDPKPNTIKQLFAKSGNMCAFPGCRNSIVNSHGIVVGEVCHIVAAQEGGKRFINNDEWTNEKRRSIENLILLCPEHHKEIDSDEKTYTVEVLQEYKKQHEQNFDPEKIVEQLENNLKEQIDLRIIEQNKLINFIADTTNSIDSKINEILRLLKPAFDMELNAYIKYVEYGISEDTIKDLHKAIMCDWLPAYLIGTYRNIDAWIGPRGSKQNNSSLILTSPTKIQEELSSLLEEWNAYIEEGKKSKLEEQCDKIAKFHTRFLQIHPFYDGNGRVSRTILISQIHTLREQWINNPFINEHEYYTALQAADQNDFTQLSNIIKKGIEKY